MLENPGRALPVMTLQQVAPISLPGVDPRYGKPISLPHKIQDIVPRSTLPAPAVMVQAQVTTVANGVDNSSSSKATAKAATTHSRRITAQVTLNTTRTSTLSSKPPLQLIDLFFFALSRLFGKLTACQCSLHISPRPRSLGTITNASTVVWSLVRYTPFFHWLGHSMGFQGSALT